jgi:hypothetical protein
MVVAGSFSIASDSQEAAKAGVATNKNNTARR